MRENLPVTDQEYLIPSGLTLVSRTDLHGTIIECNDSFEIASGFTRKELMGQPHNLVRHPDVPAYALARWWSGRTRPANRNCWTRCTRFTTAS